MTLIKDKLQHRALNVMIGLLSAVVLFHLLIITEIIPFTIVWAGKLKSKEEMLMFEGISILINLVLIVVLLFKGNYIKNNISVKLLNVILWIFVVVFTLNTVGNLLATTLFERMVFTPLTLISAILLWIIVRDKKLNSAKR